MAVSRKPNFYIQLKQIGIVVLIFLFGFSHAEFYSSIHEMSKVFEYEHQMLLHMQNFIADNESKLDFLRARLNEFETERAEAQRSGVQYFDSPLNKYLLTKRLTMDWKLIENLMATATGEKPLRRFLKQRQKTSYPTTADLEGAIDGLLRLQYIYRLRTQDIAAGVLDGVSYGVQLSSQLCLDIARLAFRDNHPQLAHAWLLEAQGRLNNPAHETQLHIWALQVQVKAELGDYRGVNETYQALLERVPASEEHMKNYEIFMNSHSEKLNETKDLYQEHEPIPTNFSTLSQFESYRYTCNGHIRTSEAERSPLRCGYLTETHPFLLLAPLKVEELSRDPLLVIYHDVIYQSEIDVVKRLTEDKIVRATVIGKNSSVVSNVRTSQFAFIPATKHKVLQTIDQRVADMTNLNMKYAELHQFANYGIGGHYAQHMDWFYPNSFETQQISSPQLGNRIATVLFYLTNVAQGGGTAFPRLKTLLMPKKGAAAFWYNLHASGVGDIRTLHGACPIIVGSKWVQNRWIREFVQADRRPCELWDDSLVSLNELIALNNLQNK